VLKTEQEIMELDHSGFTSQYPTVFAGNLGNGKYILQVILMFISRSLYLTGSFSALQSQ